MIPVVFPIEKTEPTAAVVSQFVPVPVTMALATAVLAVPVPPVFITVTLMESGVYIRTLRAAVIDWAYTIRFSTAEKTDV